MNRIAMVNLLVEDEGLRLDLYDDATGRQLKPGDTIKGHPTIGIGRALDVQPLTKEEALFLVSSSLDRAEAALDRNLPGWRTLAEVRQRVLVSMVYQMGWGGVSGFPKFLAAVKREDFDAASAEMLDSAWHAQTPARAERLAKMMREGV
jgi:lysozyme